jgi:hypothetical protein
MSNSKYLARQFIGGFLREIYAIGIRGSTIVESIRQIGPFYAKRTQSGFVFNFAGTSSPVLRKGM